LEGKDINQVRTLTPLPLNPTCARISHFSRI
jgi:hypothetical protein